MSQGEQQSTVLHDRLKSIVQHGLLSRLKNDISAAAAGCNGDCTLIVNYIDADNVSLLHWAALNNHREVAEYLIQHGAAVDHYGGSTRSTPLHWAVAQGQVAMCTLLLSLGANPALCDDRGRNALHLTAMCGHSQITGYLIARGMPPNATDTTGATALMWCAHRVTNRDPAALLLSLNAHIAMGDGVGNTALHYAAAGGNVIVTRVLLKHGAPLDSKNMAGHTPRDVAMLCHSDDVVQCIEHEYASRMVPSIGRCKLCIDKRGVRKTIMVITPPVSIAMFGVICEIPVVPWNIKLILLILLCVCIYQIKLHIFDTRMMMIVPQSVYVCTKSYVIVTYYTIYWTTRFHTNTIYEPVIYLILNIVLVVFYALCWRVDPGVIDMSLSARHATIIQLVEEEQTLPISQFCKTCVARKPLRSKHCAACDRCVAKFDHHCPWVGNCVGAGNYSYFLAFLAMLLINMLWTMYGFIQYFTSTSQCPAWRGDVEVSDSVSPTALTIFHALTCAPWVMLMMITCVAYSLWITTLLVILLYQELLISMTTNERINRRRYAHFHVANRPGHYRSPFNRGLRQNIQDLVGVDCCGLIHVNHIDWTRIYTFDDLRKAIQYGNKYDYCEQV